MKISELIEELKDYQDIHGDIDCYFRNQYTDLNGIDRDEEILITWIGYTNGDNMGIKFS